MNDYGVAEAQIFKGQARPARELGNLDLATDLLSKAISALESFRAAIPNEDLGPAEILWARELLDCYGSRGGVHRSAGRFAKSVTDYDETYKLESSNRFGFKDNASYALLQRLVARVLLRPDLIGSDPWIVEGVNLLGAFEDAANKIERQSQRSGDKWYLADRALVLLMLLKPEEEEAWENFEYPEPTIFPIRSTLRTVTDLEESLRSVQSFVTNSRFQETYRRVSAARELLTKLEQKTAKGRPPA
ncbi:MAG TPA: hypothetical protein VGS07_17130 [Thermoanaerobaculia bacterium]|jgi:tetratricopeptide (TPR) repeat protein|nr:hypothetical protein [Thermoanaerobaculia bacterium]